MNKHTTFKLSLVMAGLLALPMAQAANIGKAKYGVAKTRIGADYKAERSACAVQKSNAKGICIEEAASRQEIARAELEYSYSGKPADQTKVFVAKAEAGYTVAAEKCDAMAGAARASCLSAAKATIGKT